MIRNLQKSMKSKDLCSCVALLAGACSLLQIHTLAEGMGLRKSQKIIVSQKRFFPEDTRHFLDFAVPRPLPK